jgi:hypothetical protein
MFTFLNDYWGLMRGVSPSEEPFRRLYLPQGTFPVYWSHYTCWHVLMTHGLRRIQETLDKPEEWSLNLSAEEFLWTKLSIELIHQVDKERGK